MRARWCRVALWQMSACLLVMPVLQTRDKTHVFRVQAGMIAGTFARCRGIREVFFVYFGGLWVEVLCEACHHLN